MSIENAKACMMKMITDQEFAEKFDQIGSEEEVFSLVKGAGFDFTKTEWEQLRNKVEAKARDYYAKEITPELSGDHQEGIARPIFGTFFGFLGTIAGAVSGGVAGAAAGAPVAVVGAGPGAVAGIIGGGAGGAAAGAALGDLFGQWIEGA